MFIFFFKQKTAYEMRISDWSSDVCSSDLAEIEPTASPTEAEPVVEKPKRTRRKKVEVAAEEAIAESAAETAAPEARPEAQPESRSEAEPQSEPELRSEPDTGTPEQAPANRSEEHTSELQSLMRISYAVFCLNKKTTQTHS